MPCIPGIRARISPTTHSARGRSDGYAGDDQGRGGRGRGMRHVADPEQLLQSIALARSEAEGAFGNGDLILERD